ncbi:MAG TPA: DUF4282 domain-containing protein [Solirubrobacteraceae bacterium]
MITPQPIPTARDGFFSSLFDLSFSRLVTTRVIKVLYVLLLVVIGLGLLGFIIAAIASGGAGAIIAALIAGPLVALLYVVYARVLLEIILAIFRILETNREIAFLQRQQVALLQQQVGGSAPPAAPQPIQPAPQYPSQPPQPPAA